MNINNILPTTGVNLYNEVVQAQLHKGNTQGFAQEVAWNIVKSKFVKQEGKWVANSDAFVKPELYEFVFEATGEELVLNDEAGELVLDAVLASTKSFINPNGEARQFTEESLQELADQINLQGSTSPTFSHDELQNVVMKHGFDYEVVANELKSNRGLLKSIKAIVKEGKLWIRALLDKRYKNHVHKFKGVSLEAFTTPKGNTLTKPQYLGFILTNSPRDKSAIIV